MSDTLVQALAGKRRKAERYATEPDRFRVSSLSVAMRSEHGDRVVGYDNGKWSCTCDFFDQHETCSHVMALEIILSRCLGLALSGQSSQG